MSFPRHAGFHLTRGSRGAVLEIDGSLSGSLTVRDKSDASDILTIDTSVTPPRVAVVGRLDQQAGADRSQRSEFVEDFFQAAGTGTPGSVSTVDVSAAGSPTLDYVDDAANGVFRLATDSQSEAQTVAVYHNDQLMWDVTKNPIFEARVKVSPAGAAFTADERVVIGLASAWDNTLDDIATHAWFRLEGANLNVLVEADDGSTDTDDQDSGIDYVKGAWTLYRIDASDLSDVKFYVDGVEQSGGTVDISSATGNLQFLVAHQRDAGTEVNTVDVDYVQVTCDR